MRKLCVFGDRLIDRHESLSRSDFPPELTPESREKIAMPGDFLGNGEPPADFDNVCDGPLAEGADGIGVLF